jgi:hypothetical protein
MPWNLRVVILVLLFLPVVVITPIYLELGDWAFIAWTFFGLIAAIYVWSEEVKLSKRPGAVPNPFRMAFITVCGVYSFWWYGLHVINTKLWPGILDSQEF